MRNIEELKRVDMVTFLENHYGMTLAKQNGQYVGLSPFKEETRPSFFVKQAPDGHWVFNDFSSGKGGSLIDLVMALEGLASVGKALTYLDDILGKTISVGLPRKKSETRTYDVEDIHRKISANDWKPAGAYLLERGIKEGLVAKLGQDGMLLHNRHNERSYCCFVVRNETGALCCLDNHEIGGDGKFVLGEKTVFSLDWPRLPQAEEVFVCESIIDYLSIKTMEGDAPAGLALLGNVVLIPAGLLAQTKRIHAALDADAGGLKGVLELQAAYPEKEVVLKGYGEHKDANDALRAGRADKTNLSAEDKLNIFKAYMGSSNKAEVARRWGIDRSYMYEIVKACEGAVLAEMENRQVGRRPRDKPRNLEDANQRMKALEAARIHEATEKERMIARGEFLALHLKWARDELSELKGQPKTKKRQLKKKNKMKR